MLGAAHQVAVRHLNGNRPLQHIVVALVDLAVTAVAQDLLNAVSPNLLRMFRSIFRTRSEFLGGGIAAGPQGLWLPGLPVGRLRRSGRAPSAGWSRPRRIGRVVRIAHAPPTVRRRVASIRDKFIVAGPWKGGNKEGGKKGKRKKEEGGRASGGFAFCLCTSSLRGQRFRLAFSTKIRRIAFVAAAKKCPRLSHAGPSRYPPADLRLVDQRGSLKRLPRLFSGHLLGPPAGAVPRRPAAGVVRPPVGRRIRSGIGCGSRRSWAWLSKKRRRP